MHKNKLTYPNPVIRKKRLSTNHKRILKEGQILMAYAMEKFAGNSKMTSVCLNHKLNKNVLLSRTYYFSETLKFREEDHKLYFKHTVSKNIRV